MHTYFLMPIKFEFQHILLVRDMNLPVEAVTVTIIIRYMYKSQIFLDTCTNHDFFSKDFDSSKPYSKLFWQLHVESLS